MHITSLIIALSVTAVYLFVYFSSEGREARKVPYWGIGYAKLESLMLKSTQFFYII